MKLIYIAGPFRASKPWFVEKNIRVAEDAALQVWRLGAAALCPHTNTRFFDGLLPDEVFIAGTTLMLSKCDAMLVVGDWQESRGTKAEIEYAQSHRIPVFYSLMDLSRWFKQVTQ